VTVIVVGSLNADLTVQVPALPRPGETVTGGDLTILPGGKSANTAAAASRAGADVRLVGAVGDDGNADILLASAAKAGVDTSGVRRVPEVPTGTAMIAVDEKAENTIIVSPGANAHCSVAQVQDLELSSADVVCLALEIPIATVLAVALRAADHGATVILNASPLRAVPHELLVATSILLVNEGEAEALLGIIAADLSGDASGADAKLEAHGLQRAIITLGAEGAVVLDPTLTHIPTPTVDAVDTTGAGDAFTGALAAMIDAGDTLVAAASFAARYAAATTRKAGAQASYPAVSELGALLS
jgi:ribokinase